MPCFCTSVLLCFQIRMERKDMELRHIRYFMAVADELNFTRAAEKLCIAQPPLSRQIHELEEELGAQLFLRQPHALRLTAEGELFREYASQILALQGKSVKDIREMKTGFPGTINLATVGGRAPSLMIGWIAGFRREHAFVSYHIWNGDSDDIQERLKRGLCELGIITEPCKNPNVNSLPVYEEPWVAMIPADHPLAETNESINLKELAEEDLIIPSGDSLLQEISGWFSFVGKHPVVRCTTSHSQDALELTRQGMGIAISPASGSAAADSSVCFREIVNPHKTVRYTLIWSKMGRLSTGAQELLEYIRVHNTYGV